MMKTVDILERALAACDRLRADPRVLHAEITGSVRRGQAEVGDLDLLLVTRDPWSFERGELPAGSALDTPPARPASRSQGDVGLSPTRRVEGEVRKREAPPPDTTRTADVFIATPETYGAVLAFSTGPRLINRRLRERAAQRGFLYDFRSAAHGDFLEVRGERGPFIALYGPDGQIVPTPTEEAFFKLLGVPRQEVEHAGRRLHRRHSRGGANFARSGPVVGIKAADPPRVPRLSGARNAPSLAEAGVHQPGVACDTTRKERGPPAGSR